MNSAEKYIYKLSPIEYRGCLDNLNTIYISECREIIKPLENILKSCDVCAIAVGSDGKMERHPQSITELVYIQGEDCDNFFTPSLVVNEFNQRTKKNYKNVFDTGNDCLPSVMKIGCDTLSFALYNPRLIFPDRVLNSTFVMGNYNVFLEARKRVATEMAFTPGLSGKIHKELKNQLKNYRINTSTGTSRGLVCFDNKFQYYDEKENIGRFGFKHSFLRLTQRFLDIKTQENIRDGKIQIDEINKLPVNTVDRIEYFGIDQYLSEAYIWFLQQYHHVQEEYKDRRKLTKTTYDTDLFKNYSDIILRNCQRN